MKNINAEIISEFSARMMQLKFMELMCKYHPEVSLEMNEDNTYIDKKAEELVTFYSEGGFVLMNIMDTLGVFGNA